MRPYFILPIVCTVLAGSLPAQTPADIHPAPRRSYPFYFAVLLPQDRFVVRDATMSDLIATAFGTDAENVQGGPPWLERDRFDLIAKLPSNASKAAQQQMLQSLLTARFHLILHKGTAPMPAYILTAPKGSTKLKESDSTGAPTCNEIDQSTPPAGTVQQIRIACRNMPMDTFAQQLHDMAGGYLQKPVINSTALEGAWDFDLKWTGRGDLEKAGSEGISIFDAVEKELGLKLSLETAPRTVFLVDSVLRQPTPNAPDLAKTFPTPPLPQFDVATIKPAKAGEHGEGRITGEEVNFKNAPLKDLIDLAWDLNENDHNNIVNAPKWLADDRFDILAKVSPTSTGIPVAGGGTLPMDIYEVEEMLRALLVERFQIKAHMEDRPIDAYTLIAVKPRLKPADLTVRTACKEGPGPDGVDPRLKNPMLNRLVSCRNMTMPEICDELDQIANGYIFSPVLDATNLKGSYDFTLSFSSADRIPHSMQDTPAAAGADIAASDPNGAVSLFDAVSHQLGLKLERSRRPLPVLVIDQIQEKPTEN